MIRSVVGIVAASCFALVFFEPAEARAIPPVNVEAGVVIGYATNPGTRVPVSTDSFSGPSPLGVGFGARGGFEFSNHIYAGVAATNYFGATAQFDGYAVHETALLLGLDAGYSFHLAFLTLRPELGVGETTLTSTSYLTVAFEGYVQEFTSSATYLYVNPQLTALVNLAFLYVGADAGALVVPSVEQQTNDAKTLASFVFHGQLGARF